jgi:hypothetical protein
MTNGAVPWVSRLSRRHVSAEARVQSQTSPRAICGGQSGTGPGFSTSTSALLCQYHSTNASHSLIHHVSPMLYNHKLNTNTITNARKIADENTEAWMR